MKEADKANSAWLDIPLVRFALLFGATVLGLLTGKCVFLIITCMFDVIPEVQKYLKPICVSFPVFLALWWFRTRDSRQQIAASNAQIQQANFTSGMDKLVQNRPLQIDVGVMILLEVSKKTGAFDKEIRLAFIKRLKKLPIMPAKPTDTKMPDGVGSARVALKSLNRLSYAQYILQWLIAKQDNYAKKPELSGMRCDYQEFKDAKLELVKILPTPEEAAFWGYWVSLVDADCTTLNFDGVAYEIFDDDDAENITRDGEPYQAGSKGRLPPE